MGYRVKVAIGTRENYTAKYLTGEGRTTTASARKAGTFTSRDWAEKVANAWCAAFGGIGYEIEEVGEVSR